MRFILLLFILPLTIVAQNNLDKIKIKKEDYSLYFFQKGIKSDTITSQKNNLFVLKIGVSRRCNALIEVENGRLIPTNNDSIYQLSYMPHLNYRHFFKDSISSAEAYKTKNSSSKKPNISPCSIFKTEINGSNNTGQSKQINITIKNKSNDSLYLSNKFYYR